MKKFIFGFIVVTLFCDRLYSEPDNFIQRKDNDLIINSKSPIKDITSIGDFNSIFALVTSEHPDANIVFSYNCMGLIFCIFNLNKNDDFLLISSMVHGTEFKLKINEAISDDTIKNCYMAYVDEGDNEIQYRILGRAFTLQPNQTCQIKCHVSTMGKNNDLMFDLSRDVKGWWNSSVKSQAKMENTR